MRARQSGAYTPVVTGPSETFHSNHLSAIQVGGGTPTDAGIRKCRQLLAGTHGSEDVMFVVTDGSPNGNYIHRSEDSLQSAAIEVSNARGDDVRVIGVGVDDPSVGGMEQMFGEDGYVMVDSETLAVDLVEAYKNAID